MSKYNRNMLNPKLKKYEPSLMGKIAIIITAPAAVIGLVSVLLGMIVASMMPICFTVCIISEIIAFLGGIIVVIDMVIFNKKMAKEIAANKKEKQVKKEKDIANIVHLLAGLFIGLLLGYMFWGR